MGEYPRLEEIEVELVDPIPENVRAMKDEEFAMLVASIKENGFAEPIQVVETSDGRYRIVNGQHRFDAVTKVLGWRRVPAVILGRLCGEGEDPSSGCWSEARYWQEVIRLNNIRGDWITPQLAKRVLWLWEHYKKRMGEDDFRRALGFKAGDRLFKRAFKYTGKRKSDIGRKARRATNASVDERVRDIALAVADAMRDARDVYDSQGYFVLYYGGRDYTIIRATPELKALVMELAVEGGDLSDRLVEALRRAKDCRGSREEGSK